MKPCHYIPLLFSAVLWPSFLGCHTEDSFIRDAKSEISRFQKWSWGKSFHRQFHYDLSGMKWEADISVAPDGECRKVIRKNDNPRQASLTVGEFCNSREGWLLSTSNQKFGGFSEYQISFAKEDQLSAGLSEFTGDVGMGILAGRTLSAYVEECKIKRVSEKIDGTNYQGIQCQHQTYPNTRFFFDDSKRLKYIIIEKQKGDVLQEKRYEDDVVFEGRYLEKTTFGPFEYKAFESKPIPETYRIESSNSRIVRAATVTVSDVKACNDMFENEIPFPATLLKNGKSVSSKATGGQTFSIQNNKLLSLSAAGRPITLNRSRSGGIPLNRVTIGIAFGLMLLAGGIVWYVYPRKKLEYQPPTGEEEL